MVVGDAEGDKDRVIQRIDAALGWLGQAQTAVEKYILSLQTNADAAANTPAPAEKVHFRYYPGTPIEIRQAVEEAAKQAVATRRGLADSAYLIDAWQTYIEAAKDGRGHEWNIAADPQGSVDALRARGTELLETDGGTLRNHESALSTSLEQCSLALRNDLRATAAEGIVAGLKSGCKAPAAPPFDRKKQLIRPISTFSVSEQGISFRKCPEGYRLPTSAEATIFKAWSVDRNANKSDGLWTEDGGSCTLSGAPWLIAGKVECSGFFSSTGLTICVSRATGPLPEE
jgi:hypothetical protein